MYWIPRRKRWSIRFSLMHGQLPKAEWYTVKLLNSISSHVDVCRKMVTHDSPIFNDCASFMCTYDDTYNAPSDALSSIPPALIAK